ncbi:hypothetical protein [Microbulbifer sp. ARAS458-1]|uniref:hypothetical protein n=1 Tax=Microbulbifer sp. ARAS458-1 TaxID=3140242 RepID=UPI0038782111
MKKIFLILFLGVALSACGIYLIDSHSRSLHDNLSRSENECISALAGSNEAKEQLCTFEAILAMDSSGLSPEQVKVQEAYKKVINFDESYIFLVPGIILLSFLISVLVTNRVFGKSRGTAEPPA